jgi:hypothetical protein
MCGEKFSAKTAPKPFLIILQTLNLTPGRINNSIFEHDDTPEDRCRQLEDEFESGRGCDPH